MRHWHRCTRWWEKQLECPFRKVKGHEEDLPRDTDRLRFTRSERIRVPSLLPPRVRDTRPKVPVRQSLSTTPKLLQGDISLPFPLPVHLSDLIGIPFPEPIAILEVMQVINEAIGQVPAGFAPPPAAAAAIKENLGMEATADEADVIGAAAEVETAEFFSGIGLPDLLPVVVVPLLERLFRWLAPRKGVLGLPGRMDPKRLGSTFRSSPHRFGEAFQTGQRPSVPKTRVRGPRYSAPAPRGFGGGHITPAFRPERRLGGRKLNMQTRMRKLAVDRRQGRGQDPATF